MSAIVTGEISGMPTKGDKLAFERESQIYQPVQVGRLEMRSGLLMDGGWSQEHMDKIVDLLRPLPRHRYPSGANRCV